MKSDERLWAGLRKAYDEVRPAKGDRAGYIEFLKAIGLCLRAEKKEDDFDRWIWFMNLVQALADLDAGVVWPMLERAKPHNRPPYSTLVWEQRAYIALAIKGLLVAGMNREGATREIGQRLNDHPRRVDILSWYDRFCKRRVKNRSAANVFQNGCALLVKYSHPRQQALRYVMIANHHSFARGDITSVA